MKKLLLLFLVFTANLFAQTVIPCEFSWESAATTNGTKNFVTDVRAQPYQDPCLAYAFSAAIETMHAIENNINNPTLELSDHYLDYEAWSASNHVPTLDSSFKIAIATSDSEINSYLEECDINVPGNNCIHNSVVSNIINYPGAQRAYRIFQDDTVDPPVEAVEDAGPLGSYVTVNDANEIFASQISSDDDIKKLILEGGPIVLEVNGANYQAFRNYNTIPGLSYHAFLIIGWTDDGRWIIKDSWPDMAGIVNTKQNTDIPQKMQDDDVQLYQVSGIGINSYSHASNTINFTHNDCTPPPLTLSNISVDVDYANIGGYNYGKFWVSSNVSVDSWVWGIAYPYGYRKRSQVNQSTYSSVLLSPTPSGYVTVYVRAYKDGVTVTKERSIYLFNGQSGGGGGGGGPE